MIADPPIGEDDLNAFVDGRLAPERHALVGRFLADNSSLGERVAADIAARNGLRESLQFKAAEPIPARLRIANLAVERRRAPRRWLQVAAAIVLVALGGIGGWFAHGRFGATSIAQGEAPIAAEALRAHRLYTVETVHPVEVAAAQEAHLVQWLSRRVGKPLVAPNLNPQGYRLIGGRLLPAGHEAAALFMYENAGGGRLTLYTRLGGSEQQTAFRFETQDGVSAFSWIDNGLSYVVSAKVDRAELLPIAETIYKQFEATNDAAKGRS